MIQYVIFNLFEVGDSTLSFSCQVLVCCTFAEANTLHHHNWNWPVHILEEEVCHMRIERLHWESCKVE